MNYAGDLLFECEATGLSGLVWNCKTVGGKLLICTIQARQKKDCLIKFLFKQEKKLQCRLVHGSCRRLQLVGVSIGGRVGRLGEGFQVRAHAARALKVLLVTRW